MLFTFSNLENIIEAQILLHSYSVLFLVQSTVENIAIM